MRFSNILFMLLCVSTINGMKNVNSNNGKELSNLESLPSELLEIVIYSIPSCDVFEQNLIALKNIQLINHLFFNLLNNLLKKKRFIQHLVDNLSNKFNKNAVTIATQLGSSGAIDWIKDELKKNSELCHELLFDLCSREKMDRLSQKMLVSLLKSGVDVNVRDFSSDYPLISAINKNHFKIVRILLKFNADPTLNNLINENTITLSIFTCNPKIIFLISFAQFQTLLKKFVISKSNLVLQKFPKECGYKT